MNNENILWVPSSVQQVVSTFAGDLSSVSMEGLAVQLNIPRQSDMVFGLRPNPFNSQVPDLPVLMLVPADRSSEIFAWAHTYSQNVFPFSQYCRVMSFEDYNALSRFDQPLEIRILDRLWSSIILGEFLSQTEGQVELPYIPYSSMQACFSNIIAKVESLYGANHFRDELLNRLLAIEKRHGLASRPVSISSLTAIWNLVSQFTNSSLELSQITQGNHIGLPTSSNSLFNDRADPIFILRSKFSTLYSESIEDRVIAHSHLCEFISSAEHLEEKTLAQLIALGTLLVGRGPSHHFMIKGLAKKHPTAYIWFSFYIGLLDVKYWDEVWLKTVRGIQKQGWSGFNLERPTEADICWIEYIWMAKTFNGFKQLSSIPRSSLRSLNIEIIPGITFQVKLSLDESVSSNSTREHLVSQFEPRQNEINHILENFINLALQARHTLRKFDSGHALFSENNDLNESSPSSSGKHSGFPKGRSKTSR